MAVINVFFLNLNKKKLVQERGHPWTLGRRQHDKRRLWDRNLLGWSKLKGNLRILWKKRKPGFRLVPILYTGRSILCIVLKKHSCWLSYFSRTCAASRKNAGERARIRPQSEIVTATRSKNLLWCSSEGSAGGDIYCCIQKHIFLCLDPKASDIIITSCSPS